MSHALLDDRTRYAPPKCRSATSRTRRPTPSPLHGSSPVSPPKASHSTTSPSRRRHSTTSSPISPCKESGHDRNNDCPHHYHHHHHPRHGRHRGHRHRRGRRL